MLLSRSVALSILASLGTVNGMLIPSINDVIDVFQNLELEELKADVKTSVVESANAVAEKVQHLENIEPEVESTLAPFIGTPRETIPHKYIVVYKENVSPALAKFHQEVVSARLVEDVSKADPSDPFFVSTEGIDVEGGIIDLFDIANTLSGFSGYFLDSTIEWIRSDPNVAFVEKDSTVYANEFDTQKSAPWGLARLSHRQPLSLGNFNKYLYDNDGGEGVTAYVIDTGVYVDHKQFEGRAKWGATIPQGDSDTDGNGHGTHCAGTIASKDYGVAKKAEVVGVKVLRSNGSGSMSDVVKGVEFAAKSHQEAVKKNKKGFKGSTANMSLGGGKSPALDLAVNAAVKAGIHFSVAAGNENQDAANTSPASAELAITVGASTISDARAYFSNYGSTVDVFAPGLNILSTYIGSETATASLSGTSMASPHICGLLAYFLSLQPGSDSEYFTSDKGISPRQMKKNLVKFATSGILSDIPSDGTPNLLAFNGAGHNISTFFGGAEYGSASVAITTEKEDIFADVSEKLESMYNVIKSDADQLLSEVENLVSGVYKRE